MNPFGMNILHWASVQGETDLVRYYIKQGGDVDIRQLDGRTGFYFLFFFIFFCSGGDGV
jgi:hypothetical protein